MSISLEKGLQILMTLAKPSSGRDHPASALKDVAAAVAFDKATTYRLLRSLVKYNLVEQDAEGRYLLGTGAMALSQAALDANSLLRRVLPVMHVLHQQTDETISLAERRGNVSITVHELPSRQAVRYTNPIGAVSPLHLGGGCRATLAFSPPAIRQSVLNEPLTSATENSITDRAKLERSLAKVRADGYATSAGERVRGTVGVAVPLLDRQAVSVGSLSILWPSRGAAMDADRRKRWPILILDAVKSLQGTF